MTSKEKKDYLNSKRKLEEFKKQNSEFKGLTPAESKELTVNEIYTYPKETLKAMAKRRVGRPRKKAAAKAVTHKKRRGRPRAISAPKTTRRKKHTKKRASGMVCVDAATAVRLRKIGIKI